MLDSISRPSKVLFAFTFAVQLIGSLYESWLSEPPLAYSYLLHFAHASILLWWLKEDTRNADETLPLDYGFFLYLAWFVIIPYHLFATRGLRGFVGIFGYIAAILAGWLTAVLIVLFLQSQA